MTLDMNEFMQSGIPRLNDLNIDISNPSYQVYRHLIEGLNLALSANARGCLLDIGCGNKPYQPLVEGLVREYVGCDVVQSSDQCVDVICPATKLAFEEQAFDTVLCTQVIEHIDDHSALLSEIFRVLRPGGKLVLSGPMYWPLHEEPHDYFRFTEYGFEYLLCKAGFEVVSISRNGGKWALCGQVVIHTLEGTRLYTKLAIKLVNRIFAFLQDRHANRSDWNTMNYVVVAKRPDEAKK
jgi:SAM-dependent methyltransferase